LGEDAAPNGYEPPRIPAGGENPEAWSIDAINSAFKPLKPEPAYNASEQYTQMVNMWQEGVETFARSITRSISDAWEGASADAAKAAIGDLCTKAQALNGPLEGLATAIYTCSDSTGRARDAIPAPVAVTWTSWFNPYHRGTLEAQQGEHKAQAREAFSNYYVKPLTQVDGQIPVFPAVSDPTKPLDLSTPSGPAVGPAPGPAVGPSDPAGPNSVPEPGNSKDQKPDQNANPAADQPASAQSMPGSAVPSSTNAAGLQSSSSNLSSTATAGYTGGGSPGDASGLGGPGGLGGGLGGSNGPGAAPGGAGRSVPGGPGAANAQAAGAAARAGTSASGMMPGIGGMGGAGRGKSDSESGEHKRSVDLTSEENTRELLGDEPRTLPGGVIGGDYEKKFLPGAEG